MKLEIKMDDLLKDLPEHVHLMEYLAFFRTYAMEVYDIDPDDDFGLNAAYTEKFGKEPPKDIK